MASSVLDLYRRVTRWPGGQWLFSRGVCWQAPYFASIAPRVGVLKPGCCEATIRHRRKVTNHLGTVHAIALCNLAELAAGLMTDATIPDSMRWIPKGMSVRYLKKAHGTLVGTAKPEFEIATADSGYELPVRVEVRDGAGDLVFDAAVAMWLSPSPSAAPASRSA